MLDAPKTEHQTVDMSYRYGYTYKNTHSVMHIEPPKKYEEDEYV